MVDEGGWVVDEGVWVVDEGVWVVDEGVWVVELRLDSGWADNCCILLYHCSPPEVNCSAYKDCDDCVTDERCGWCNDESNTGLGACSEGGFNSDLKGECSNALWYFDGCPCESMAKCLHSGSSQLAF